MREQKERWMKLCEQASIEQDPKRLLELVREINGLLAKKQHRLSCAWINSDAFTKTKSALTIDL